MLFINLLAKCIILLKDIDIASLIKESSKNNKKIALITGN